MTAHAAAISASDLTTGLRVLVPMVALALIMLFLGWFRSRGQV
ncbi:hypothetical protein CLV30_1284 [Haloactinopolyspora alba]|uniref:Uncharacterized protein n=1 Tax=Haloactinopolyspora alba TaxID=648780 RepID=A0A2P8DEW0_9ACTN|nr:hypothetical protein [Haloactinopolyspora alba]PSK95752.1 hypothetical protein CLV30_1284 [Haloactinopolyspora alba]